MTSLSMRLIAVVLVALCFCLVTVHCQPRRSDIYGDEVLSNVDGDTSAYLAPPEDIASWILRARMTKRNSELLNTLLGSKSLAALRAAGRR